MGPGAVIIDTCIQLADHHDHVTNSLDFLYIIVYASVLSDVCTVPMVCVCPWSVHG